MQPKNHLKLAVVVAALLAAAVWAAEPVVCFTSFVSTVSVPSTDAGPGDGGTGTCVWAKGSTVLMQCTNDVFVNSTAGAAASSSDLRVDFTNNLDPVPVYLDSNETTISVRGVTDGGTCKFAATKRPKPWQAK